MCDKIERTYEVTSIVCGFTAPTMSINRPLPFDIVMCSIGEPILHIFYL